MSNQDTDWVTGGATRGFGQHTDTDEYLHGTGPAGDALTETWYWGFNVPEERINCYVYCWVHPNLGVASAGLFIYQGIKRQHLAAELFDLPMFLSAEVIGDGGDIRVPNGLRMTVIEPLRHIHMTYHDSSRDTEVDIHLNALAAPVVRANSKHFEQIMHTTGHLVLRGRRHQVDSYNIRDRSWGELRPESHNPSPPYTWVTGVLTDGSAGFTIGALDDPDQQPHWATDFHLSSTSAFKDGWWWRDGRAVRIDTATKRTHRDPDSLRPTQHIISGHDIDGHAFHITGDIVAGLPWGGWHNATCHLGLVRWNINGHLAWGDSMDVQWNDYVWRYGQTAKQDQTPDTTH
jgi:hypothetical protein